MKKEFVMRGQTESGQQEVLNFSGSKLGYAYRLVEFNLFPSQNIGGSSPELAGSITAGKIAGSPFGPDFSDEGLIGNVMMKAPASSNYGPLEISVVNDTFLITQNLILMVQETSGEPINWQCRFVSVKMTGPEEATTNYKQFTISDE